MTYIILALSQIMNKHAFTLITNSTAKNNRAYKIFTRRENCGGEKEKGREYMTRINISLFTLQQILLSNK